MFKSNVDMNAAPGVSVYLSDKDKGKCESAIIQVQHTIKTGKDDKS